MNPIRIASPEPSQILLGITGSGTGGFGGGIIGPSQPEGKHRTHPRLLLPVTTGTFGALLQEALTEKKASPTLSKTGNKNSGQETDDPPERSEYLPVTATPTDQLEKLLVFRSLNPLYGMFLLENMGIASEAERLQALESVLEVPGSIFMQVKAPGPDELPPGPLATTKLDLLLIERGLATAEEIDPSKQDEDEYGRRRSRGLLLGDKLRRIFDSEFPSVGNLRTSPVWIAGALLEFGGDFHKYVTSRDLAKQEGSSSGICPAHSPLRRVLATLSA
ncbi:MAG: hypothetical protein R3C02_22530 [Planctomycetaceae bacterium]